MKVITSILLTVTFPIWVIPAAVALLCYEGYTCMYEIVTGTGEGW